VRSRPELLLLLAVAACGGEDPAPAPTSGFRSVWERPCPEGSALTWETFGEGFVRTWCTSCHSRDLAEGVRQGAPLDVNLDTAGGVRRHLDRVWAMAADGNASMPPVGGPSPEDRERLGEWLACGAR
jgi:hypothetical protein